MKFACYKTIIDTATTISKYLKNDKISLTMPQTCYERIITFLLDKLFGECITCKYHEDGIYINLIILFFVIS